MIGLSVLSGSHLEITRQLVATLADAGAGEIPVVVGGIVPPATPPRSGRWACAPSSRRRTTTSRA